MTTTEDLHERATEAYNAAAERQAARAPLGPRDTSPWRDGIRAVVDLVLAEREPTADGASLRGLVCGDEVDHPDDRRQAAGWAAAG